MKPKTRVLLVEPDARVAAALAKELWDGGLVPEAVSTAEGALPGCESMPLPLVHPGAPAGGGEGS